MFPYIYTYICVGGGACLAASSLLSVRLRSAPCQSSLQHTSCLGLRGYSKLRTHTAPRVVLYS